MKSTLLNALYKALGGYAETTRLATFGAAADQGGNTPSLARLHGPRLILVPDIPPKKEFGTGLLKQWTGNDPIEASQKYEKPITFYPAGKLWFVGNHAVRIPYDDEASWRRLQVIPFEQSLPQEEQDPHIGERIDLRAVLAWAVRGWQLYREEGGLNPPKRIREAVAEYREESDPLASFVEDCCVAGGTVSKGRLFDAYQTWADRNGIRRKLSKKAFGQILKARPGVDEGRRDGERFWKEVSLKE
jgi:putative DNA primase/helicase